MASQHGRFAVSIQALSGIRMWDDLDEPLGIGVAPARESAPMQTLRTALRAVAAAAALAAALGVFTIATRPPSPKEPFAVAKIEMAPAPIASPSPAVAASAPAAPPPARASADQVEATSGVKVTRAGGAPPPSGLIIDVDQALSAAAGAAPNTHVGEPSPNGRLIGVGAR